MKIGIACTNALPVPVPSHEIYANQEIAGQLADRLAVLGHDVTLFAPVGSRTRAKLVTFDMLPFSDPKVYGRFHADRSFSDYEHLFMAKIFKYAQTQGFDVLHMHLRPLSVAPFAAQSSLPTLQTIHDPLSYPYFKMLELYNEFENLGMVSISLAQRKALPELKMFANVYNGLDLGRWPYDPRGGDGYCWSGRVIREKGTHRAMAIAREMGLKLKMAGYVYPGDQDDPDSYWNSQVKPLLSEDITLDYVPAERMPELYGGAKAFLNPLDWEEPFGMVMIEAMACGTPVIAFNRGSVGEIVQDGVTGFVVENEAEMLKAIAKIDTIDRADCRAHVEQNFSLEKMAENYLSKYAELVASTSR